MFYSVNMFNMVKKKKSKQTLLATYFGQNKETFFTALLLHCISLPATLSAVGSGWTKLMDGWMLS